MSRKQLYNGRPDLPNIEPHYIADGASSNDTDEVYCIDTLGSSVTLGAGLKKVNEDGSKAASEWAGVAFTGVLYGRWTNVAVGAGEAAACYYVNPANTEG